KTYPTSDSPSLAACLESAMTPRQRVLAALNHQQPDRTPIDFGGHRSSGIAAIAYGKLRAALGLPARTIRVYDPIQQLAIVDEDVLERFRVDAIEMGRGSDLEHDYLDRLPEAMEENMWCGIASPPGPLVAGADGPQRLAEGARKLREG